MPNVDRSPSRGLLAALAFTVLAAGSGCDVGGRKGSSGSNARRGWIPDSAREATAVKDLRASPGNDPLCAERQSAIDVGKALAVGIERELRESTKVSDVEESRIGKRLEAAAARERSFQGKWDLPDDVRTYGGYLRGLVAHIAKGKTRAGIQYRVHIVRRPEFNAAALPGGALMVFTGLLEGPNAVRDEAELVAVLGHEIAHVEKRHTIAAYQYAKAILGDGDAGAIVMKILGLPLSSERELEADEHGLELAVKSQYDPQAAVNLWRRRAASDSGGPMGALGQILEEVLRTHPRPAIRACRAMHKVVWAREHSPWDRLYDGRSNLAARVMGPSRTY